MPCGFDRRFTFVVDEHHGYGRGTRVSLHTSLLSPGCGQGKRLRFCYMFNSGLGVCKHVCTVRHRREEYKNVSFHSIPNVYACQQL